MAEINVFYKIGSEGHRPVYATAHAAGCDLFASRDLVIRPGETVIMPLDLVIALPEGTEAQIRPRSGLSLRTDLRLPNSPGTIDADYRNEVGVILQNTFNPALIPHMAAAQPQIIATLKKYYRPVSLGDYLAEKQPLSDMLAETMDESWQQFVNSVVFIDENDNPYGTIYIKKDDRIAQMIITRHIRANFIEHENPAAIGCDRGGGFGSTGINDQDK